MYWCEEWGKETSRMNDRIYCLFLSNEVDASNIYVDGKLEAKRGWVVN